MDVTQSRAGRMSTNVNILATAARASTLMALGAEQVSGSVDGTVHLWEMAPWVSERRSPSTTLSRALSSAGVESP